jgi:hypothetical protein
MSTRGIFILRALIVGLVAFASAAAFSAYLKPGMLVEFANLILCG